MKTLSTSGLSLPVAPVTKIFIVGCTHTGGLNNFVSVADIVGELRQIGMLYVYYVMECRAEIALQHAEKNVLHHGVHAKSGMALSDAPAQCVAPLPL